MRNVGRRSGPAALLILALGSARSGTAGVPCGPCPAPSFDRTPRVFTLAYGGFQDQIARADIDRDGNLDLIVGNFAFSAVAVFPGSSNGTFSEPVTFPAETAGNAVAAADFDLDGWIDVAATDFQQRFAFLRGDGAGGLEPPVFTELDEAAIRIAAGDFNGDRRPDLALILYPGDRVQLRFGDGSGGFESFVTLPVGPGASSLAVSDIDGNSFADLVVPNSGSNSVSVILGRPSALFPPPSNFFAGPNPHGAAAADFDGDGHPDLAVAVSQFSTESQGLSILKGNGAGGFGSPAFVTVPQGFLLSGHFDENETTDLVLYDQDSLVRLLGDGNGGFSVAVADRVGASILVGGDFNRDGVDDLVGRFGSAFATLLSSGGVLDLPRTFPQPLSSARPMATGDLNGDGISDLAVAAVFAQIQVLLSDGAGGLTPGATLSLPHDPGLIRLEDVNSDSKVDVLATSGSDLLVFLAAGGGAFGPPTSYAGAAGLSFAVGLLDGDSNVDLVITRSTDNSIAVMRGTGGGAFGAPVAYAVGSFPQDVRFGHFNGDANLDVAVVNSGSVSILLGDGAGAFSSISSFPVLGSWSSIEVGDFDGDGHPDVVVPLAGTDQAAFLPGDGLGALGTPQLFPIGFPYGEQLVSADFNADGRPDVAVSSTDVLAVITRGVSSFDPPVLFSPGGGAVRCRPGDFDDDGKADLACGANSVVSLLLNTNCEFRHLGVGVEVSVCNVAGTPFSTQPVVRAEDDGGNVVSCESGPVSASIVPGTGTPGAVLGGTTSVEMGSGVASFSDLSVNQPGVGYRLQFVHEGVKALSRSFATGLSPIAVASAVCPYSSGHTAAVPDAGPDAVYLWTIGNGVITSGAGTRMITFKAGPSGSVTLGVRVVVAGLPCDLEREAVVAVDASLSCPAPVGFFTVTPCRVLDTRDPAGTWGGPSLAGGAVRVFPISGRCGIPATARSVAINVTVVGPTQAGHLTLFPSGTAAPGSSTINFRAGIVRANNAILALGAAGDLSVLCTLGAPGTTHFILDVNGYFE